MEFSSNPVPIRLHYAPNDAERALPDLSAPLETILENTANGAVPTVMNESVVVARYSWYLNLTGSSTLSTRVRELGLQAFNSNSSIFLLSLSNSFRNG
uniref:Uncharacterized protein n=1 Tax=Timema monikensis TaxID=170555 RepID=A0A7R9EHX7_9NEOP|nr:unnamed protein product [Timema monikensis]